jgi:hypothetical protein
MSSSDYLAIKKRKHSIPFLSQPSASERTRNTQFLTIQTTPLINEDGEFIEQTDRFSVTFPSNQDYAVLSIKQDSVNKPVFTIPRVRTNEYIKNRYQPPFCWNCYIPIDIDNVITHFGCSTCDTIQSLQGSVQSLIQEVTDESTQPINLLTS